MHDDVEALIRQANAARPGPATGSATRERPTSPAESELETRFRCSERLAVYGTLAPGRPNHHVVAPLGGSWSEGFVEGEWLTTGWAAAHGYRALRWQPGAERITAHLLAAPGLREAWPMLDRFEGPEYRRILIPVYRSTSGASAVAATAAGPGGGGGRELIAVANLYEAVVR